MQPDITPIATTAGQGCRMVVHREEKVTEGDESACEPLPDLKAGREVGWIFTHGEAVAIERREHEVRVREDAN